MTYNELTFRKKNKTAQAFCAIVAQVLDAGPQAKTVISMWKHAVGYGDGYITIAPSTPGVDFLRLVSARTTRQKWRSSRYHDYRGLMLAAQRLSDRYGCQEALYWRNFRWNVIGYLMYSDTWFIHDDDTQWVLASLREVFQNE